MIRQKEKAWVVRREADAHSEGGGTGGLSDRVELKIDDHWRGRQHLGPDLCPTLLWPQIHWALQQLLFPSKAFSWPRHVAIALILLVSVNVLVICVPTIQDIFGITGQYPNPSPRPHLITGLVPQTYIDSCFSCLSSRAHLSTQPHLHPSQPLLPPHCPL